MPQTNIDDVESLRAAIAIGLGPAFLFFWGHTAKDASVGKHVLSEWWPAAFVINGQEFRTAEHYMMAEKAHLFGDEACRAQIIAATSAADVKALGRKVRGFDEERWVDKRFEIALRFDQRASKRSPRRMVGPLLPHDRTPARPITISQKCHKPPTAPRLRFFRQELSVAEWNVGASG